MMGTSFEEPQSLREIALAFHQRGVLVIDLPYGSKNPARRDWPEQRFDESTLNKRFSAKRNLGFILGEGSQWLVDVDCDAPAAVSLARDFLPKTPTIHGRPSKPASHFWYISRETKTLKFKSSSGMLVELRANGCQTIVPPSVHPSGELLSWEGEYNPAPVVATELTACVAQLAAASLLAETWPRQTGSRHEFALASSGLLARGGALESLAVKMITAAARYAGDDEVDDREQTVHDTYLKLAQGEAVTGRAKAVEQLGEEVVKRLNEWLGLDPWQPPIPFDSIDRPDFPVGALPQPLAAFVRAQSEALQVSPDLVAGVALGTIATAAAPRMVIRLTTDWTEPLNAFIANVANVGERKSATFRAVTKPLGDVESQMQSIEAGEIAEQRTELEILEKKLSNAKNAAAKGVSSGERDYTRDAAALAIQIADFRVPVPTRFTCDDATPEALASLLAEQRGAIALMSAEGGVVEMMAGQYHDSPHLDVYLKGHAGDPIRVDRKGRLPEFIDNPRLTICVTVQPDVVQTIGANRTLMARGIAARYWYAVPASRVGFRTTDAPPMPAEHRQWWDRCIRTLLDLPNDIGSDQALQLSEEATTLFSVFRDQIELRLRPGSELSEIADWGAKLPGAVARIVALLHAVECGDRPSTGGISPPPWMFPIAGETMQSAIEIGEYFSAHAQIAYGLMNSDGKIQSANHVWQAIARNGMSDFRERDLWQLVRRRYEMHELGSILQTLAEMGYLRQQSDHRTGPGRHPSRRWQVNPKATGSGDSSQTI
jgi:hypothetical protein